MNMNLFRYVVRDFVRRTVVLASLIAASALPAHAQVVFSPPKNISNNFNTSQFSPTIATDAQGDIYLAWVSSSNIYFSSSSNGGTTFSPPVQVPGAHGGEISMVLDSTGNIYIAWRAPGSSAGSGGILVSRSSDRGATFSGPVAVTTTFGDSPQLAVDPSGRLEVVWLSITGSTTIIPCPSDCAPFTTFDYTAFFSQSVDRGNSFFPPTAVFTTHGDGPGQGPSAQLAVGSAGVVYVLGSDSGRFVALARSTDSGASFSLINIQNSLIGFSQPKMTLDAAGNIDVVWTAWVGRYHVFFSRSTNMGATFSSPADLTPSSNGADSPKISVDSSGNIYVAWFEGEPNFNPAGTISFSRSTDGGTTFSSPLALSTDPSGFTNFAGEWGAITVGQLGGISVTWEDKTPAGAWEIFFSRSNDFGATFTSPMSVSGPGASGSFSLAPVLVATSNSDVCLAWVHTDQWPGGPFSVYSSRSAALSSVTLGPTDVTGGSSSTGTVTMNGPAPTGGAVVSLSSSDPSVTLPATVTIPEGTTSTSFNMTTSPVASATTAIISAVFNGVTQTASITVEPPVLTSLTLNPSSATGGTSSTGTVTLSGPAPAGGVAVALSSSNTSVATVPSSVTVSPGFTNATFTVNTDLLLCSNSVTITASSGSVTLRANRAVLPLVNLPPQACSAIGAHGGGPQRPPRPK